MAEITPLNPYTLLYVDDEEANLTALARTFRLDYEVLTATSGLQGLEILRRREVHLIMTDQRMPGMTGLEFLQQAILLCPSAVRIILTAFTDNEVLLKAIQEGKVYDYVLKPWRREAMAKTLHQAITFYQSQVERLKSLQNRVENAEKQLEEIYCEEIIGARGGLAKILEQIRKVAPTNSTILLRGESGTGKELIARAIHQNSLRREAPFVKINANAFSEGVLESELFGHEKGAFTGALQQKKGRFELADGGSLLLDEVGDLSKNIQVKLLRVLQEREFERVGGTRTLKVNVRLITATHRPLELLLEEGKLREDLFYRINVIPLWVPALRERSEDIPQLVEYFLKQWNQNLGKNVTLASSALNALTQYPWPGNVRELKNIMERIVVLADREAVIEASDLPFSLSQETPLESLASWNKSKPLRQQLKDQESERMATALQQARGNLTEAGRLLGIPRTTLFSRLKKIGNGLGCVDNEFS